MMEQRNITASTCLNETGSGTLLLAGSPRDVPSSDWNGTSMSPDLPSFGYGYTFAMEGDGLMTSPSVTTSIPLSSTSPRSSGGPLPSQRYIPGSSITVTGSAVEAHCDSFFRPSQQSFPPAATSSSSSLFSIQAPGILYHQIPQNSQSASGTGTAIDIVPLSSAMMLGQSNFTEATSWSTTFRVPPAEPLCMDPCMVGSHNPVNCFMDTNDEEHPEAWVLVDPYNLELAGTNPDSSLVSEGPQVEAVESHSGPSEESTSSAPTKIPMYMRNPKEEGLSEQEKRKILKAIFSHNYRLAQNNKLNALKKENHAMKQKILNARSTKNALVRSIRQKMRLIEALRMGSQISD